MKEEEERTPLRTILQNFLNHIEKLDKEKLEGSYDKEFQELKLFSEFLKTSKQYSCFQGEKEVNKKKNRYKDILPFDCSRVILEDYAGIPGSDYINANYIKGASGSPAYIASQGPLPHTVNDFWRMVVQCEVQVIVMACNEEEAGKHKCENYWVEREGEEKQFGMVAIQLMKASVVCPDFLVRTMRLKYTKSHSSIQEERTVCQFHYSAWPDHGVPPLVRPLLDMVRLVRDTQASETLPVLVHCSAGCGRTGTICAIDYVWGLLRAGKLTRDFSLFKLVREMRKQRIAMVQTKEQYVLVHHAVKELFNEQLRMIDSHPYENIDVNGMVKESPEPLYATITPEIYSEEKQDTNEKEGVSAEGEDAPPLPCKRKAYTAHTKQEKEVENRTQKHRSTTSEQASSSGSSSPGPSPNGSTTSSSGLLHRPRIAKLRALFERTSNREGKNMQDKNRTHQQVTRSHSLGAVRKVEESGSFVQPIPNQGVLRVPQLSLTSDATFVRSGRPALPIKRSKSLKVLSSSERSKFSVLGMQSGMCSESQYNDVKKEVARDKVCRTVSASVSDKSVDEVKPLVPPKKVPRDKISEHKVPKSLANSYKTSSSQNVHPVVKKNENVSLSHQQSSSMNCWRRSLDSLPLDSELSVSSAYQVANEVPAKRQESYRLDDAAEKLFHDCKDYLSDKSQSDSSEPPVNMEMRYQDTMHIDSLQHLTVEVQRKLNTVGTSLGSRERRNSFRQAISKETCPNRRPRCYESSSSNNTNAEIIDITRTHSDISGASERTSTDPSHLKTKFVPKPNHNVTSQLQVPTRSGQSGKSFCLKVEHKSCSQYQKAALDACSGSQVAAMGPFLGQSECSTQNIYSNPKEVASFQGRGIPQVDGSRCSKSTPQSRDNVNVKEKVESCSTVRHDPRHSAHITVPLHPKMKNPCLPSSSRLAETFSHSERRVPGNTSNSVSAPSTEKMSASVTKRVASSSKGRVPISIPSSTKHEQSQPGKLEIAALGRTAYVKSSSLHPLLVHSETSCTPGSTNNQNSINEDADISMELRLADSHAMPPKINSKREVGMKAEPHGSRPSARLEVGAGAVRRVDASQGSSRLPGGDKSMVPHSGVPLNQEQGLWGLEVGVGSKRSREVPAPALDKAERNLGPVVPNKGGRQKCEIQAVENPSYGNTAASSHKNVSRQEMEAWIGAPGVDVDMVGASIKASRDHGTSLARALQAFNFRKSSRGLSVSPPQQRRSPPQQPQVFVKKQHYL